MVPVNQFNVIIASLVFDVVAISDKMYITALTNVLQYLKVRSRKNKIKPYLVLFSHIEIRKCNVLSFFLCIAWRNNSDPWKST